LRLPQGLCSAPEIFVAEINNILKDVDGVVIHMHDILVSGESKEEHDTRLQIVLGKLKASGITLNEDKCKFEVPSVNFLGYVIDQFGIQVGPRVEGVVDFPTPQNVTSVRSFLGMANQYAKFSEELAAVSEPIRMLLKKDVPWHWSSKQENSIYGPLICG